MTEKQINLNTKKNIKNIKNIKNCTICFEDLTFPQVIYKCGHSYCLICFSRLAFLRNKPECYCSNKDIEIFLDNSEIRQKNKFRDLNIFCSKKCINLLNKILKPICIICFKKFPTKEILQNHLKEQHSTVYCEECVINMPIFPFEFPVYSFENLNKHANGEKIKFLTANFNLETEKLKIRKEENVFGGHPFCKFCEIKFFDGDALKSHCNQKHFICKVCLTNKDYRYFNSKDNVISHLMRYHKFLDCCSTDLKDVDMYVHNEFLFMQHKIKFHNQKGQKINLTKEKEEDTSALNPYYLKKIIKEEEKNISLLKQKKFLSEKLSKKDIKESKSQNILIEENIERKNYQKVDIKIPLKNIKDQTNKTKILENINKEVRKHLDGEIFLTELIDLLKIQISDREIINLFSSYKNLFEDFKDEKVYLKIIDDLKFPPFNVKEKIHKNTQPKKEEKKLFFKIVDLTKK